MPSTTKPVAQSEIKELENEILEKNPKVFQGISEQQKTEILQTLTLSYSYKHSGPLPSPNDLEHYNQIIDSGAECIMSMAENERSHRHKIESALTSTSAKLATKGQWFALLTAISGFGLGTFTMNGHDWVGGTLLSSTLAAIVTAFLVGRN